eukprot:NODE_572_length_6559_cov_0.536842.p3 type:complete len:278 gc:universal NODE_572_length_6559_cov_0.536842:5926-5093(-)
MKRHERKRKINYNSLISPYSMLLASVLFADGIQNACIRRYRSLKSQLSTTVHLSDVHFVIKNCKDTLAFDEVEDAIDIAEYFRYNNNPPELFKNRNCRTWYELIHRNPKTVSNLVEVALAHCVASFTREEIKKLHEMEDDKNRSVALTRHCKKWYSATIENPDGDDTKNVLDKCYDVLSNEEFERVVGICNNGYSRRSGPIVKYNLASFASYKIDQQKVYSVMRNCESVLPEVSLSNLQIKGNKLQDLYKKSKKKYEKLPFYRRWLAELKRRLTFSK